MFLPNFCAMCFVLFRCLFVVVLFCFLWGWQFISELVVPWFCLFVVFLGGGCFCFLFVFCFFFSNSYQKQPLDDRTKDRKVSFSPVLKLYSSGLQAAAAAFDFLQNLTTERVINWLWNLLASVALKFTGQNSFEIYWAE